MISPIPAPPRRPRLADIFETPLVRDAQISPDGSKVAYVLVRADQELDDNVSTIWLVDVESGVSRQLTKGRQDHAPRWSPDSRSLVYVGAGTSGTSSPWLLRLIDGEPQELAAIEGWVSDPRWSPDGRSVAFLAMLDADRAAPVVETRLEMKVDGLGYRRHRRTHLFVVDIATGMLRQLTSGDFDVSDPSWSPTSEKICFVSAMHGGRDLDGASHVYELDVSTGAHSQLTFGRGTATAPAYSADGSTIHHVGQEELSVGHNSLFAVATSGGSPISLLTDFDLNVSVGSVGYPGAVPLAVGDSIVFSARDGGYAHLFTVPSPGGESRHLFGRRGTNIGGLSYSPQTGLLATVRSDAESPGEVVVISAESGAEHVLTTHVKGALPGVQPFPAAARTFTAPDGKSISGWLIRGSDKPGAPLLLDVHGGPHNSWAPVYDVFHIYQHVLASSGWNILLVDPRGSDGYGEAFFRGAMGAWGEADAGDLLCAVDQLIGEGIADPHRVAVAGYSYGGYMACWLTAHTDRFAAAVAGAGTANLISMFGASEAAHLFDALDLQANPGEDAQRLAELSPITQVRRVTTPTLILHGEDDMNTPVGQGEEWFAALRRQGVPVELVRYPGADHLFPYTGRPSHRVDFNQRIVVWLQRWCVDDAKATFHQEGT